jgi:hypothetical protein
MHEKRDGSDERPREDDRERITPGILASWDEIGGDERE